MSSFVKQGGCEFSDFYANHSQITNASEKTKKALEEHKKCLNELEAVKNRILCKSEVTKHYQVRYI